MLNARITKKSFLRWNFFRTLSSEIFKSFSLCISSSKNTHDYLKILGARNIKYFGNIKFCSNLEDETIEDSQFKSLSNKKAWCAISTHEGEENFCGKVHSIIKESNKNILTIIIPRHIHRTERIFSTLKDLGLKIQIKSESDKIDNNSDIVLVNYYGAVSKYLKYFKHIFVGKSLLKKFEKTGGQNPIDAIKMGCFIYHGPYVYNFEEIYHYLGETGLSEEIKDSEGFASKLIKNFEVNLETDSEKIKNLNIYSKTIFDNVIKEYNNLIR